MVTHGDTSSDNGFEKEGGKSQQEEQATECMRDAEPHSGPHGMSSISLAQSPGEKILTQAYYMLTTSLML